METHPIKEVLRKAKVSQKEACEKTGLKQSTLSSRMNREIEGSIEQSIDIAKAFEIKKFLIVRDGYEIRVTLK